MGTVWRPLAAAPCAYGCRATCARARRPASPGRPVRGGHPIEEAPHRGVAQQRQHLTVVRCGTEVGGGAQVRAAERQARRRPQNPRRPLHLHPQRQTPHLRPAHLQVAGQAELVGRVEGEIEPLGRKALRQRRGHVLEEAATAPLRVRGGVDRPAGAVHPAPAKQLPAHEDPQPHDFPRSLLLVHGHQSEGLAEGTIVVLPAPVSAQIGEVFAVHGHAE